ncbi:MAG TPA: radical SAM protein [Anaerolineae bacterium]|nr:radical SAM protein [Anaerolineae bacterium]HIQ07910.1 radical SAM protein [Anaerolineaceae bacterium]
MERTPFLLPSQAFEPAYLRLYRSGELQRRAARAQEALAACRLCPRACGVNRLADERGVCRTGRRAVVSSAFPHFGEEDCLRGWRGSGTLFFAWCNLRCVFCQNEEISHRGQGREVTAEELAALMLALQEEGVHNLNLVTPEHVVPQILEALVLAVEQGLRLPIVYNTSAYDGLESLRLLDGVVDIYMPDFKVWSTQAARRYLKAPDYPQVARQALREMHRQVGDLQLDEHGLAKRGLLVRHLVMPGLLEETRAIMRFLASEISPDTCVNLMAQYYPAGEVSAGRYAEINRRITPEEFRQAVAWAKAQGLWRFAG